MNLILNLVLGILLFLQLGRVKAPLNMKEVYCCLYCGEKHVMCKNPQDKIRGECLNRKIVKRGLAANETTLIINIINEYRNFVANGKNGKFKAPAADMREMSWDDELAMFAQRHADGCLGWQGDGCHESIRFTVGQIMWVNRWDATIKQLFQMMFDTHKKCDTEKQYCDQYSNAAKVYAQMVFGKTYLMGCGFMMTIDKEDKVEQNLVCNYSFFPNASDAPYVRGTPCSKCSNGTSCSPRYNALCTDSINDTSRIVIFNTHYYWAIAIFITIFVIS